DLQRLARAIGQTEPGLFETQKPVTIVFRASTPHKRGGFQYVEREDDDDFERLTSRRLMCLGDLAFRLNACTGMKWIDRTGVRNNVQKQVERVRVVVEPPTAHEKAEAFLMLVDWLD